MVTELYPTSCTILYKDNERDHAKRVADLENVRSVLGYDSIKEDTNKSESRVNQSNDH